MKVQKNFFRVQCIDPTLLPERIEEFVALGLGLELRDFMLPALLDSSRDLSTWVEAYQSIIEGRVSLSVHGPVVDLNLGSLDRKIRRVSTARIIQSLEVAKKLNADFLIAHTGYDSRFLSSSNRFKSWVSQSLESYEYVLSKVVFAKNFKALCIENSPGEPISQYWIYVQMLRDKFPGFPISACLDYDHLPVERERPRKKLPALYLQDPTTTYLHLGLNKRGRAIYQDLPVGHHLRSICLEGKVGKNLKQQLQRWMTPLGSTSTNLKE